MKKIIALILALVMVVGCLAACSGGDTPAPADPGTPADPAAPADPADPATPAVEAPEGAAAEQVVKLYYSDEISDWNPMHPSSGTTWANWIDTLVEYDNYGLCQPCLAESWTRSEDGLTWTFKIREGVKWQLYDGTEYGADVVAEDWVTTAKWILNPVNTARTADLLFDVVGAEEYYYAEEAAAGTGDWDAVGIKAISTYELAFTLEAPCPYFLSRLTYNWGYPTNAAYLEEQGASFGTNNDTILYCGAFLCDEYEPNSYIISHRNPLYWDIENIHIERIEKYFNAEEETLAPEALLRGEVTYADIPNSQIDEWLSDPEKAARIRPARPSSYSHFYLINFKPAYAEGEREGYTLDCEQWLKAANNVAFRKSLYYGLDRLKAIGTYEPESPETYLLATITPTNFCAADGVDYTQLEPLLPYTSVSQFQAEEALKYRDQAIAELTAAGVTFPIVAYMPYNTDDSKHTDLAVVVSQQLEALLGTDYIKFVLEGYPDTDFLAVTRRAGNYSFMMSYWGPDYADPQTWTDPFALGQAYNYIWHADGFATQTTAEAGDGRMGRSGYDETYWKDSIYDNKVAAAGEEAIDMAARYNAFAEVEAWLIEQAVVIPLGAIHSTGYVASNLSPFESQFAAFGVSEDRYKYQWVYETSMGTEEYLAGLEVWEAERAARMTAAQEAGIDY